MTPTARTLQTCKANGWRADVVERRLPFCHVTKDLFGFIDVLALADGMTLGIQATTGDNHAARVAKITGECREAAKDWLRAGNHLEVWSFTKPKNRYVLRREAITLEQLA